MSTTIVKEQYGRVKGASWFPLLYKKDILVLGQGGIGSWLSLLLSRIGVTLYTFDDDRYEAHNMSGQAVRLKDIGKNKAEAVREIINEFSPDCEVNTHGKYKADSFSSEIVVCGFDNMNARKIAFTNWKEQLTDDNRTNCFFMDGRLNPEQLQILCISGNRLDLIERYEKEYLFDDEKVADLECTFKQTSHTAAMIASHMVAFLTNWIYNSGKEGKSIRTVPFYYEYMVPLNLTTSNERL